MESDGGAADLGKDLLLRGQPSECCGLGLNFTRARGQEDLCRDGPRRREGGENDNKQSLLRFLKIKDVNHRREL